MFSYISLVSLCLFSMIGTIQKSYGFDNSRAIYMPARNLLSDALDDSKFTLVNQL